MGDSTPVIYLLAGVTASGKSEHALRWAQQMKGKILSCDSIAVYRGMDVGSAKPTSEDRSKVMHHGIDLVDASELFSVLDYSLYAREVIDSAIDEKKPILITGGSGFYLQSFLSPVVDRVEVSLEVRQEVEQVNERQGLQGMLTILKKLNPHGLGELDVLNPRRVMRALERCLTSGKTLVELKKEFEEQEKPYVGFEKRVLWLDRGNDEIESRIAKRTEQMLENGLLREAEKLVSSGIYNNPSASNSIGYRECIACLKGEITELDLAKEIKNSTRRLVSKQRKWFRKHLGENASFMLSDTSELGEPSQWNWVRHS